MKCFAVFASVALFGGYVAESATSVATATFGNNTDITGSVSVAAGNLNVNIDLSKLNMSSLPANCTAGGLKYHIHTAWNHFDDVFAMDYLTTGCNQTYTNGHYDPWLACSSSSANTYCTVNGGCVNGSSALDNTNDIYNCSTSDYEEQPYACEVGDWSGKYGYLDIDSTKLTGSSESSSAWEVDASDLEGRSIVFHCQDDTRAFCAPFELSTQDNDESRDEQTSSTSKKAVFTEMNNSTLILKNTGEVEIDFNLSGLVVGDEITCGGQFIYRVYNSWETASVVTNGTRRRLMQVPPSNGNTTTAAPSNTTAAAPVTGNTTAVSGPTQAPSAPPTYAPTSAPVNCSAVVGSFYDPTVSCATDSEHSDYCKGKSHDLLCGEIDYKYNCSYTNDKYSCAPGDLSGKYGEIDRSSNSTLFYKSATDDLMIALDLLEGKSLVIQCVESTEIVACAEFTDYNGGSSSGSSSSSSGTPVWVWIVVAIGGILLIVGAIFLCRRCRSDDSYTRIQK